LGEVIPLPAKAKPGRPRRKRKPKDLTLRFTAMQKDYLTLLAEKAGLARDANALAKLIIEKEMMRLQTDGFHGPYFQWPPVDGESD